MKEALSYAPIEQRPQNMPLRNIPLADERGSVSFKLLNTAGHELNHALTAYALGVPVVSISVVREGNILGKTTLGGVQSIEKAKIIAAAGSVATHDGSAHGFGSDMAKVHIMHQGNGGTSPESAAHIASSIVSQIPHEVREKAAELLAYERKISGSSLPDILKRAEFEITFEQGAFEDASYEGTTTIEYFENGQQLITWRDGNDNVIDRILVDEEDFSNKQEPADSEQIDENQESHSLPRQGVIIDFQRSISSTPQPMHRAA